ncbi:hypothetical protein J7481_06545 [Labrenzia sp. R4_2]|uniref:hypothetical protein n=1 Tax=Labrenzia sp. R4_2 TaxID=2821107 RepID=UPI001AD9E7A0|nr:hypothetical protein [Labrenzia sp. R4_2]MBO9419147.1 hypothetical protein [Labrenzia sp. R4_2]
MPASSRAGEGQPIRACAWVKVAAVDSGEERPFAAILIKVCCADEAAIWNADLNDGFEFTLETLPDVPETA